MKFSHVIIYVPDVEETLSFYERAFDLKRTFLHDSGEFGELDTGGTALSFASEALAHENLNTGFTELRADQPPPGIELAFMTDNVDLALERAVKEGAILYAEKEAKPWGQEVAYVRDPSGVLIEIGTSMD